MSQLIIRAFPRHALTSLPPSFQGADDAQRL